MEPLADLGRVPVQSGVTFADRDEALASPAAELRLVFCPACCHVYNIAFDPSLIAYDANYDNTLHHSRTFRSYASELARHLTDEYDLQGKHVVELGSGKGHFLVELCRTADARGTGYDPSYDDDAGDPRVTFVRSYLSWDDAGEFDFFVSRHVVEHLLEPHEFLTGLRRACGTRRVCGYIEVPDGIYDFERSPWNCHYPHVSYFSATGLARLAIRAGFGLLRLVRSFEGQYLALELGVNVPTPDQIMFTGMGLHREREILVEFRERYPSIIGGWRDRLESISYERCALWGAGAKGLGFLNAVDPERRLAAVVDLNPGKRGHYLPVTGHSISAPDDLRGRDVDTVVITNPAYRAEIEAALVVLGLEAEILSAH
jgi:methyltransferase family protein/C-methyltransferase-like protein